jgi:hypothetical protein
MNTIYWDFVMLVKQMREAQNAYFKNRTQSSLVVAKRLEATVDEKIAYEVAQIRKTSIQLKAEWDDAPSDGSGKTFTGQKGGLS